MGELSLLKLCDSRFELFRLLTCKCGPALRESEGGGKKATEKERQWLQIWAKEYLVFVLGVPVG